MSMISVRFSFRTSLMKLIADVSSSRVGTGGCGWFISISVHRLTVVSWPFLKTDDISNSAGESTMFSSIFHSALSDPFSLVGICRFL